MEEKRKSIRDAFVRFKQNPELNADALLSHLNKMKDDWTGDRKTSFDNQARMNLAFYTGNHRVRDRGNNTNYRVNLRENHTNNVLSRMNSIFVQNMPIVRVFPNTIQDADIRNAENTEMYSKYFWRTQKLEQKFTRWVKSSSIFGHSFIYRGWNPDKGGKILLDASDMPNGEAQMREYSGDPEVTIDDPFRIAVRPGIYSIDEMYDLVRSEPVNRFDLEAKYGEIEADAANGLNVFTGELRRDDDRVMLHHYFHIPTNWFEEGLYACWAGKKILKAQEYKFTDEKLPVIELAFDRPELRFWAMAPIEQVMDLQEQLNRASGMIVEARNLMARPRAWVPNECNMPGNMVNDIPGAALKYDAKGGFKPEFAVPSFNFAELSAHKTDIRNALQAVMGMTSASRGEIPTATRTALALQLVLEQDRSQYLPFIKTYHQGMLDAMTGVLACAADNIDADDPRTIKIEGMNTPRTFHGGMVPSPLDAYLEDTNPLGWTAAGRIEAVGELIKNGIIKDRNVILEMLKLNSPEPAFQLININRQSQQKENELLEKGQILEIGPEDDDAVHAEELEKVMASFSFRGKPAAVRDAFIAHSQAHKERLMKGMGGGAPKPPGMNASSVDPRALQAGMAPPQPGANINALLSKE